MKNLIEVAAKEIGVKETKGTEHSSRILKYSKEIGFDHINDDETPWCSIFMNWVAKNAGFERTKSAAARSWLTVGQEVARPEPGDVVIFWRVKPDSWQGHVGIFVGYSQDNQRIYSLGGNQGDQVSITGYGKDQLLGFRRLAPVRKIQLTARTLRKGDNGQEVRELQDALRIAHFSPGTSDGDFGPKTEQAVKFLQATKFGLKVDGVFNSKTREHLNSLL